MHKVHIAIVGAGIGGLCAAIKLREAGENSLVILDRSSEVGGTWRDNVYPGCACDVPSHLYSFSFEPNTEWTRPYPQQPEIQDYLLRVTEKYDLRRDIRFNSDVQSLRWSSDLEVWQIDIAGGPGIEAKHVILATGPLNKPLIPNLAGLADFEGPSFHSSEWRHDIDLRGKRVAIVGTGASAVQFVPEVAAVAEQVTVFQRTAAWVLPRWDVPYGALRRWIYRSIPGLQLLSRWRVYWFNEMVGLGFMGAQWMQSLLKRLAFQHLHAQVATPTLRSTLTPNFNPGCKRLLISNTWFPTLQKAHVALVSQPVASVGPKEVVAADGKTYPCDLIIWGTGFKASEFISPIKVYGESLQGQTPELSAQWRTGPAATRLGITVAGFPNLFLVVGPNTGLGHNSIIFMIECQVNYIVKAIQASKQAVGGVLRLRAQVQQQDYARVQTQMKGTVWSSGCHSWYQNTQGNIDTLWPSYTWRYWLQTRHFTSSDYS
ncbi:MAG: 4-hydroxyacetophenone monooxygenase [Burkholderiales bacterium PBB3]|nr:MAG: 4-hydroxyacetophenone monooxygenase [Burkholderiales bacterium PBB3]